MGDRQRALGEAIAAAARTQVGVFEWAEGSNPAVEQYWLDAGMEAQADEVPWCAAFVGGVLGRCGVPGTRSGLARSYAEWGDPVAFSDVQPGDVIVSWRGSPGGWQGHVEIAVEWRGSTLWTVGGNEGNAVQLAPYDRARFLAARRARPPREKITVSTSKTLREATKAGAGTILAQIPDAVEAARPVLPLLDRLPPWTMHAVAGLGVGLALWGVAELIRERLRKAREGDR